MAVEICIYSGSTSYDLIREGLKKTVSIIMCKKTVAVEKNFPIGCHASLGPN